MAQPHSANFVASGYPNALLGTFGINQTAAYLMGLAQHPSGSNLPTNPILGRYGFFNAHGGSIAINPLLSAFPGILGKKRVMIAAGNIIRWQTDTQDQGDLIWPYGNLTAPT